MADNKVVATSSSDDHLLVGSETTLEESRHVMFKNEEGPHKVDEESRSNRRGRLAGLIRDQKAFRKLSVRHLLVEDDDGADADAEIGPRSLQDSNGKVIGAESKLALANEQRMKSIRDKKISAEELFTLPVEVRIKGLTYTALFNRSEPKIKTVYNSSSLYRLGKKWKRFRGKIPPAKTEEKHILKDINLVFKPGTQYLVLGPPASGKSSLLKAIAGRLHLDKQTKMSLTGTVEYNGKEMNHKKNKEQQKYYIENVVAYIDQLDRHAPRYTVQETFEFAFQCKTGGVAPQRSMQENLKKSGNHDAIKNSEEANEPTDMSSRVRIGLEYLGLYHVKDTFVGDSNVRGVSGGQRRRVTVGEMIMDQTPILCGDEISTGLDAASTYEMVDLATFYGRTQEATRIFALLQPSPETVSLFDEVIVLAEGKILYAGPIDSVEQYFQDLGYAPPPECDVADFLQVLSTPDAAALWSCPESKNGIERTTAYSVDELAEIFVQSEIHRAILKDLNSPHRYVWDDGQRKVVNESDIESNAHIPVHLSSWKAVHRRYANSFPRSAWLNLKRSIILWIRDRRVLIANFLKNAIMGVSVGGVFWQTTDPISILGVLFQSMLFIMLGASTAAPALTDDRVIFRKHFEANFFSPYPFIIGRAISQMPQILSDVLVFGSILYFMVGLHLSASSFFVFIAILFSFSLLITQIMAVFAAGASTKSTVQGINSGLLLVCILFGGFIVPPDVIPGYWEWIYWWNPFAWAYRALLLLEFESDDWSDGSAILVSMGFIAPDGNAFPKEWIWYWFAYMAGHYILCVFAAAWALGMYAGSENSSSASSEIVEPTGKGDEKNSNDGESDIPFVPATLTFKDICYDVQASTGKETLRLLNKVTGAFEAGRMCALMGSSGAGKTTLMDVIAMRKNTGTVSGEVLVNGFPQDEVSFRRFAGYVEQFDVQSPELTVFETILFSARLRLDESQISSDEGKVEFVNLLMKLLELSPFADSLVGIAEDGGLSFEQKKRLSIAVELAASPSIIFLDEPTSGLDARSALLVVKLLREIASTGRTICATIHQPSSAVFEMFDDLLLLKKGGYTVYFGELGKHSNKLVAYFENRGARPIQRGENPANWVLTAMTSGDRDFAKDFLESDEYTRTQGRLVEIQANRSPEKEISYDEVFACPKKQRSHLMSTRLMTIYWRSPSYNLSRVTVAAFIAVIMGSVLIVDRPNDTFTETQMRAQFATIFLSFIIMGIMSIFSVLPIMMSIRDMYYRHRASGMIGPVSLAWSLGYAEKGFILVSSTIFCAIFLFVSFHPSAQTVRGGLAFWGFFTFNIAIYSYFGQAFVCFFKPMATAQILASVFIGLNNFFSGLIVRPQYMTGLFAITYWIAPGHFVYEGMITAMYHQDNRLVVADNNTDFYNYLGCAEQNFTTTEQCTGTLEQYMLIFFGGKFQHDHTVRNLIILAVILCVARFTTFLALCYINFSAT